MKCAVKILSFQHYIVIYLQKEKFLVSVYSCSDFALLESSTSLKQRSPGLLTERAKSLRTVCYYIYKFMTLSLIGKGILRDQWFMLMIHIIL